MLTDKRVLELVDLIYTAASDSSQWPAVLERLSRLVDGELAVIHYENQTPRQAGLAALWNIDPSAFAEYAKYYAYRNPYFTARPEIFHEGGVYPGQLLCPDEIMRRSEFYNDFLIRLGVSDGLGATVMQSGTCLSQLSVFRKSNSGRFGEAECEVLRVFMPHLKRAFQLHGRIQELESENQAAVDALDRLPTGVVLLGSQGRPILVNRAASQIFASEKGLRISPVGLSAAIPSENKHLNSLIAAAVSTGEGKGIHPGGMMTISRETSSHSWQVLVTPLRTKTISFGKNVPVAAMFIADADRKPLLGPQMLSQLYNLTPAEARLAEVLAAGGSLKEAAEQFGVAQSTVQSQLKAIFEKTNTNRQAELIRLLIAIPTT